MPLWGKTNTTTANVQNKMIQSCGATIEEAKQAVNIVKAKIPENEEKYENMRKENSTVLNKYISM